MISHSKTDPGRTLGAGNTVVRGQHFWGGSHIGYNRMNFRGPDYSSFQISPGSHMDQVATHWYRKGRSEEHTSELQSRLHLVCRLLLEKKKKKKKKIQMNTKNKINE